MDLEPEEQSENSFAWRGPGVSGTQGTLKDKTSEDRKLGMPSYRSLISPRDNMSLERIL